jgi:hypothetical protein
MSRFSRRELDFTPAIAFQYLEAGVPCGLWHREKCQSLIYFYMRMVGPLYYEFDQIKSKKY